jgi:hypothetical protein
MTSEMKFKIYDDWLKTRNTNLWSIDYERGVSRGFCSALDVACDVANPHFKNKIDTQAKEIEALRGFANAMLRHRNALGFYIEDDLEAFNLIDGNGNPTTLLTGSDNDTKP